MNQPLHLIFDLDGTIIDSKQEIVKTYQHVFDQLRPSVLPNLNSLNFGATLVSVLTSIYGNDPIKIAKAKLLFATLYDKSDYSETNLYPEVTSTLEHLTRIGHKLFIATNKRLIPTLRILENKNIRHFFSDVMANEMITGLTLAKSDMIASLKSKYFFSDGFMIGDTSSDIEAGNIHNLKTIAVTYGYENRSIFAAQKPTFIIDSFSELTQILKGNIYEAK